MHILSANDLRAESTPRTIADAIGTLLEDAEQTFFIATDTQLICDLTVRRHWSTQALEDLFDALNDDTSYYVTVHQQVDEKSDPDVTRQNRLGESLHWVTAHLERKTLLNWLNGWFSSNVKKSGNPLYLLIASHVCQEDISVLCSATTTTVHTSTDDLAREAERHIANGQSLSDMHAVLYREDSISTGVAQRRALALQTKTVAVTLPED